MRHAISLAAIPVVVWLAWPASRSEIVAKTVETEGVRAQRMDATTFRLRWSPVSDLPPAVRQAVVREEARAARIDVLQTVGATVSARPRPRMVKRVSLVRDICARHGMRKVHTGRTWRCRR